MNITGKRLLSMVMVWVLVLSMLPFAWAEEASEPSTEEKYYVSVSNPPTSIKQGDPSEEVTAMVQHHLKG